MDDSQRRRFGLRTWIASLSALLLSVGLCPGAEPSAKNVVAVVNGKQLDGAQLQMAFFTGQLRDGSDQAALLERLVDRELLRQFLAKKKIVADPQLLDHQVAVTREAIEKQGGTLENALQKLQLDDASLRETLALPIAWRQHVQATMTDRQLQEDWEKHRQELDGTRVQAAQIVRVLPTDADEAARQQARVLLANVRARVLSGESTFAEEAARHSQSPTAKNGGDLGEFEYFGRVDETISKAAFGLQPGEISQPIETRFGVHLVQTNKRIPGDLSLEDVRGELIRRLSDQMWRDQVSQERAKAKIQITPKPSPSQSP